jgi:hypothetical protein
LVYAELSAGRAEDQLRRLLRINAIVANLDATEHLAQRTRNIRP